MIRAPAQVTQASQRVGGKVAPRKAGVVMLIDRPWSPPNTPGYWSASEGSATASISVAPARYGPRSRAAATPKIAPATAAITTLAANTSSSGQFRCISSSAAA